MTSPGHNELTLVTLNSFYEFTLHFLSFLNTEMVQVIEILPHGKRQWPYIVNTVAADVLVMQGARASAGMVLI